MARWILAVTVTLLLCGGCGVTAVETPTPTPPLGPTGPSPTPSPTPIETPIPEPTPTPGPTPTPVLSCPPTPTTAAEIVAMSVPTAAACYGGAALTIEGYSVDCGGCGGVDEYDRSPAWLALNVPRYALSGSVPTPGQEQITSFPMFMDPASGIVFPAAGSFVRVTGHFNDPAAATCKVTPKPGSSVSALDPASVITACRASFVVTAVSEVTP
jgi:hypothetical protein